MNKRIYKNLQLKLNEYLLNHYEKETEEDRLSLESIPIEMSETIGEISTGSIFASPAMKSERRSRSLDDVVEEVADTFSESLFRLIDQKSRDEVEVYKQAGLSRQVFSKIRSNKDYKPKKNTAVALCISLQLSLDETEDLLNKAGYALSKSSLFDMIIKFFIEENVYDMGVINEALDDHGEQVLIG